MAIVSSKEFCRLLYCGFVESHTIALLDKRITISVNRTDGEQTQTYLIVFEGVISFGWVSEDANKWERMELSIIGLERPDGPQGDWHVYMNPWYTTEIEFQCAAITVDGTEVIYDGDCLQDSLPDGGS